MNIYINGGATTQFGELWEVSLRDLIHDAIHSSLKDAKLEPKDIDAVYVGNMLAGVLENQTNLGSIVAEELGRFVPAFRVEGACASGGLALHNAINSIKAGVYETVLVLGVEKMTDRSTEDVTHALMAAGAESERLAGATFPGLYALMAQAYMDTYKAKREDIAANSVKNHFHGTFNPKAQFQKAITVESVLKSAKVASPLHVLDCSPVSDGASSVIITSKEIGKNPIRITASEVATDTLGLFQRKSFVSLNSVVTAVKKAYEKSGITSKDLDVVELHDCFSIAEVIATEDVGLSLRGEGAKDIAKGKFTLGKGKIITNSSGGLKACGHPVGATGIKQIVELMNQLRGTADKRQIDGAKIGLAHNVGGSGTVAVMHIVQV